MIATANYHLLDEEYKNKKVKFVVGDNFHLTFPQNLFDLVSARNTNYEPSEVYKILKEGGTFVIQGVDTKDCYELKNYFKRGQGYNDTENESEKEYNKFKDLGFKSVKLYKILFNEYYTNKEELLKLLLKAPIINNFENDNVIEEDILDNYIKKYQTDKGIELRRIYFGILAIK